MEKYISPVLPFLKPNFKNKFPIFKNLFDWLIPPSKNNKKYVTGKQVRLGIIIFQGMKIKKVVDPHATD